jgi:hypothetical protein
VSTEQGASLSKTEKQMRAVQTLRRDLEGIIRKKRHLFGTEAGQETDLSLRVPHLASARTAKRWAEEILELSMTVYNFAEESRGLHGCPSLERLLSTCIGHLKATLAIMDALETLTLLPDNTSIRYIGSKLARWCVLLPDWVDAGITITGAALGAVVCVVASPVIGIPVG